MSGVVTGGLVKPRVEVSAVELLACSCGAPHPGWAPYEADPQNPRAVLPRKLIAECPSCGAPTNTGQTRFVRGRIVGFWGGVVQAMWDFGERLYNYGASLK